ncbi:MAG TPA: DUF1080 domain-containing protein [Bryobacteraceae bacterium]
MLLAATLAAMFACAYAAMAQPGGYMPLFDGKTLAGWRVEAKSADRGKKFWTVRDGAIHCDSHGRKDHDYVWLASDGEYADFDLKLKVRGFPPAQIVNRENTGLFARTCVGQDGGIVRFQPLAPSGAKFGRPHAQPGHSFEPVRKRSGSRCCASTFTDDYSLPAASRII